MQHNPASFTGIDFHKKPISGVLPPGSVHFQSLQKKQ
ncbi:hypothetical protein BAMY6639_07940 [Bacillus amyloliquefaciens UMAF6639]|nr:hypothetical protein BAMY6639_07940 [Bacillus amyloliquefaciens UMAF6639]